MRLRTIITGVIVSSCLLALAVSHPYAQTAAPSARDSQQLIALADQIAKEVEALRGWTFKQPVKKEMTTVPQMVEYVRTQVDETLPASRANVVQAFLQTIGLIPKTIELRKTWLTLLENQVGGFYDTKSRSMHLVSRPGTPPLVERIVLAHELTHALDDQYVDLDAFTKQRENESEDIGLVKESVVEGSATALMMQYMARAMMNGSFDIQQLQDYARQEQERSKPFLQAPRYFSAMLASYICGTQFLAKGNLMALMTMADDKPIGEALMAARKDPPVSTEQILHPDKYWNATRRDDPVVFNDAAAAAWLARPGRWVVHQNTVGEMLTAMLTGTPGTAINAMALQTAEAWTNPAAAGWGGDRFYLLASGPSRDAARQSLADMKGVWVTAWDSVKDRDEFLAALPKGAISMDGAPVAVGDVLAVVYFGIDAAEQAALTKQLIAKPLPMTKSGKAWTVTGQ